VAYDAVVVGETVELRIRDPELLTGEGYTAGEPVFVLRPIAAEPHGFQVEARMRPAAPKPYVYDHARSAASCVASWTHVGGKPLQAEQAIDRLVVQTVKIEPAPAAFVHEGLRVVGCTGLAEARAVEAETVLGRNPTQAPPKWVVVHDAGVRDAGVVPAGAHDAGAPAAHDAGIPVLHHDAGIPVLHHDAGAPSGKGYGAPCFANPQCASGHCVNQMCR
jgi:hypothetical protein